MRRQRIDVILHILSEKVELDFHRADLRVALSFETAKLLKEERQSRRLAEEMESSEMHGMVEMYNDGDKHGQVS